MGKETENEKSCEGSGCLGLGGAHVQAWGKKQGREAGITGPKYAVTTVGSRQGRKNSRGGERALVNWRGAVNQVDSPQSPERGEKVGA